MRNHRKTAKNCAKKDWLNKEALSFLARKSFKNQENIKRKQEDENICQNGRVEISGQSLRDKTIVI